jgi:hypothetical protein
VQVLVLSQAFDPTLPVDAQLDAWKAVQDGEASPGGWRSVK